MADQNWYELSQQINIDKTVRNWLKEAQTIRNRWAHAPVGGLDDKTRYRDLDTIERFLQAFSTGQLEMETLCSTKKTLLNKLAESDNNLA